MRGEFHIEKVTGSGSLREQSSCSSSPSKYGGSTLTHLARLSDKHVFSGDRLHLFIKYRIPNVHGFLSSLLASLLILWLPSTVAQLTIESVPPISAEGDNVLLFVHNLPENVQAFSWYTGVMALKSREIARYEIATNSRTLGTAHSGRATVFNNGSLLIKNVTRKDSGYYILQTLDTHLRSEITRVEFFVHGKSFFVTFWCW